MNSTTSTIAAIATASGNSAISILKLSGNDCLQVASVLLRTHPLKLRPRYASLRPVYDKNGHVLDEVIVLYFKAPHSYTGEDVLEFQCHGGDFIANSILDSLLEFDCVRLARPGEFSLRAVLNGRMDMSQAEAVAQLVQVKDTMSHHLFVRQMRGSLGDFVKKQRHDLLTSLAYSEVNIDYAEEDLPTGLIEHIATVIERKIIDFQHLLDASKNYERFSNGLSIALLGKPNTGKSSLLNSLLMRERAIVSDVAGTTRDTIEESCIIAHHNVRLIDSAGVRDSTDKIEAQGVQRSLESARESDIVLAVFDASKPLDEDDRAVMAMLSSFSSVVIVLNKIDCGMCIDKKEFLNFDSVEVSAKHHHIDSLREILKKKIDYTPTEDLLLNSKRQIEIFSNIINNLNQSLVPLYEGELELFSFWIKESLHELNALVHPYQINELFDVMFERFCLGK